MAQKTVVTVVCDLPHDGEIEGNETVSFAFDGASYEIDVCSAHAKELHDTFAPYAEHSRRVSGGGPAPQGRAPGRAGSAARKSGPGRAQRGHKVSERGRIPASIIAEYEASH